MHRKFEKPANPTILKARDNPQLSHWRDEVFKSPAEEQTLIPSEELRQWFDKIIERCHGLDRYWKPEDDLPERAGLGF